MDGKNTLTRSIYAVEGIIYSDPHQSVKKLG